MKTAFLHLSDIHYTPDRPESTELVLARLLEDIASLPDLPSDRFLVISGDLVRAGESKTAYDLLAAKLDGAFTSSGFPKDRRIVVPGNHDVSRASLKSLLLIQSATLSAIREETQFNDECPALSEVVFSKAFANYKTAEPKFAALSCCQSSIDGCGWDLPSGVGIYCLNTALCSTGGLGTPQSPGMSDRGLLHVNTRNLHAWLARSNSTTRVLVMHHPIDWLAEWSQRELSTIIANKFRLVFCGHVHHACSTFASVGGPATVSCVAPALFTNKHDTLGYSVVVLDSDRQQVSVIYRHWASSQKFVRGSALAGNDEGILVFDSKRQGVSVQDLPKPRTSTSTEERLMSEFNEASTCYSSKRQFWVSRDLSLIAETSRRSADAKLFAVEELADAVHSSVISAPKEFGLSCIGYYLALVHFRRAGNADVLAVLDAGALPNNPKGIDEAITARCQELGTDRTRLAGVVLDNWTNDKNGSKVLRYLQTVIGTKPVVLLNSLDDSRDLAEGITNEGMPPFTMYYLWSLSRTRVRELVSDYILEHDNLDEDAVTQKLISDLDALNIHRTPLNCLLMLKLLSQAFDDSPVNRTEMISRVLFALFHEFDNIPRYAHRPDLKDCEYAIGYLCEWLVRNERASFERNEFFRIVAEFCEKHLIDLDCDVLFSFLVSENIFVRRDNKFGFRFNYWLFYFAAHRMYHSETFAEFIFSNGRYASMLEVIEFYTGLDRRRTDAVRKLTADLRDMHTEFVARTGIPEAFDPYRHALWKPSDESIMRMEKEVVNGIVESAMPKSVKDAMADKRYDRSRPYRQELASFIQESSLHKYVETMRGAARALRNSDYVDPAAKTELLREVMRAWVCMGQAIVMISVALAKDGEAAFEGCGFILADKMEGESELEKWQAVISAMPDNVVSWFHEDIFSKKLGPLFCDFANSTDQPIAELFVILLLVQHRPPGWEKQVEAFIVSEHKNSFALARTYGALRQEFRAGIASERSKQQLRRLAGMAAAKHVTGVKHPGTKSIEEVAKRNVDRAVEGPERSEPEGFGESDKDK